ncbi:MAG TPA: hypothetical protein VHW44_13815 [Pseudonocardiaceae bacterium]|nr:hypothetical protein [Pseudonocardiaceae bacterium]
MLFGQPLSVPPCPDVRNKILRVSGVDTRGDSLTIPRALDGRPPKAGCWSLDLSWSGHHDQLTVPYVQRAG